METVVKTKDYDQFSFINGNRDINEPHVRRLMSSLKEEQLVSFIIVNGKNEIIDGQNRFEACKRLGLPVYVYKDSKTAKYGLNQVQRYNTNNMTWNKRAYLKSYCSLGVEPYLRVREFLENYPEFGISSAIAILANVSYRLKDYKTENGIEFMASRPFEEGQLTIPDLQRSYDNVAKLRAYNKFFADYSRRSFVSVMLQLFQNKKFSHEHFIKKLEVSPIPLRRCATANAYKTLIEEIYNYKSREKVSLRY